MEVHPLRLPDLPDLADRGQARAIMRGRKTVAQVLAEAAQRMDAEDEAEEYARDPVRWIRAHRKRTLLDRLLGR